MRLYRLINKKSGKVCAGVHWNKKTAKTESGYHALWITKNKSEYLPIKRINYIVEALLTHNLTSDLDLLELETIERIHKPINSSVKLKNIRGRIEREIIFSTLKYG